MPNPIKNDFPNPPNPPLLKGGEGGLHFSFRVAEKDQGRRLDQFLSEADLNLSRSQAKKLIEAGAILLNQKPTKPSAHLKAGEVVSGTLPQPKPLSLKPEPLPLTILYEDSSIIVIDKPPGMVVHPAAGNPSGTLVNALLYLDEERAMEEIPTLQMLKVDLSILKKRGRRLLKRLSETIKKRTEIALREDISQVGGGALPLQELPTIVLALKPIDFSVNSLEESLRKVEPPIISRISKDELILDMRTVFDEEIPLLAAGIEKAIKHLQSE